MIPARPRVGFRKKMFARWYDTMTARYEEYIRERKRALFADLPSTVMEIGPGTGANLAYLPEGCRWIGVEPNPYMHDPLRKRAERFGVRAECWLAAAEGIDMEESGIEAAVCTLVLCSVANPARVLAEVRRVLRPGGRLYFIEHVAAPRKTWLRRWQRVMRPLWMWLGDGCRPDRETGVAIRNAGFAAVEMEEFRAPRGVMPRFVAPQIAGIAIK